MSGQFSRSQSNFQPLSDLDHPYLEVKETVDQILASTPNAAVYFKFTCEKCLTRQTFDVPNVLYLTGRCEECNHVTDIKKRGCNFMLHVEGRL
jgi:hypothetical protein